MMTCGRNSIHASRATFLKQIVFIIIIITIIIIAVVDDVNTIINNIIINDIVIQKQNISQNREATTHKLKHLSSDNGKTSCRKKVT